MRWLRMGTRREIVSLKWPKWVALVWILPATARPSIWYQLAPNNLTRPCDGCICISKMAKRRPTTSDIARGVLRQLASEPEKAGVTESCELELIRHGLTKNDVCDAICDWIDSGNILHLALTDKARGHIEEGMWELYPTIGRHKWYVKVRAQVAEGGRFRLFMISVHPYKERQGGNP